MHQMCWQPVGWGFPTGSAVVGSGFHQHVVGRGSPGLVGWGSPGRGGSGFPKTWWVGVPLEVVGRGSPGGGALGFPRTQRTAGGTRLVGG